MGVTVTGTPLVTAPTPLSIKPSPLLKTAVSAVEFPAVIVAKPEVKPLSIGAGTTDRVQLWTASLPIPFCALNVRLYVPASPTAGVPASRPVEALNVRPLGSVPLSKKTGAGNPVAVTVNDPNVPTVNVVLFALVMTGAAAIATMDAPQIEPAHALIAADPFGAIA